MLLLLYKGLKLFPVYALPLFWFRMPRKTQLFRILESFRGGERTVRKIQYCSRSLIKFEGVPLDLLIGDIQDLQKSLAFASKYILSFSFSWVSFGLELFWFAVRVFVAPSTHLLITRPIASLIHAANVSATYIWALCMPGTWLELGDNGVQNLIWFLPSGSFILVRKQTLVRKIRSVTVSSVKCNKGEVCGELRGC